MKQSYSYFWKTLGGVTVEVSLLNYLIRQNQSQSKLFNVDLILSNWKQLHLANEIDSSAIHLEKVLGFAENVILYWYKRHNRLSSLCIASTILLM